MVNITLREVDENEKALWNEFYNAYNDYSEQLVGQVAGESFGNPKALNRASEKIGSGDVLGAIPDAISGITSVTKMLGANTFSPFLNVVSGISEAATSANTTVTKGKFEKIAKELGFDDTQIEALMQGAVLQKLKLKELNNSTNGEVTEFTEAEQTILNNAEKVLNSKGWSSVPTPNAEGTEYNAGFTPVPIVAQDTTQTATVDSLGNTVPTNTSNDVVTTLGLSGGVPQVVNQDGTGYNPDAYIGLEKYNQGIGINPTTGIAERTTATFKYGDVPNFFQGKSEEEIIRLKKVLTWSGAYGKNDIVSLNANITQEDLNAVQNAMGIANLNGFTNIEEALSERYKQGLLNGTPYGDANIDLNGDGKADKSTIDAISQLAANNGLTFSEDYIKNYSEAIMRGETTYEEVDKEIREKFIANAYPMWADDIKAGKNIKDIASPYMSTMASVLELDPTSIDLNDPMITSALAGTSPDGKPTYKSLFDFKRDLRQDPRWQNTEEAQKEYSSTAMTVLKTFGIIG